MSVDSLFDRSHKVQRPLLLDEFTGKQKHNLLGGQVPLIA
jgi:hypothetical protein